MRSNNLVPPSRLRAVPSPFLIEGRNCWKRAVAKRAGLLIDAQAYFSAFKEAVQRAQRRIAILAWDIHPYLELPSPSLPGPDRLIDLLEEQLHRQPELQVFIAYWPAAVIFKAERERESELPRIFSSHPRIHFAHSRYHPPGAGNHEKLVVIDDAIAFLGGLDLARDRWDTQEHLAYDPKRINPLGSHFRPFHDMQMVFDAEAAKVASEYFRNRWEQIQGERLPPVHTVSPYRWPSRWPIHFKNVSVGFSRTMPKFGPEPGVREIEIFYLDAIAAAKTTIYIECEYLTSENIARALASRLREEDGPEILLVGPQRSTSWVEETTMDTLRSRCLAELREADRYGRFGAYYPIVPRIGDDFVSVHSKLMVIDDRLLHVGSSNLSNRSLGVDSECDITLETQGRTDERDSISFVVYELLAEHLGRSTAEVRRHHHELGSLLETVEKLRGGERTLEVLDEETNLLEPFVPTAVDPSHPYDLEEIIAVPQKAQPRSRFSLVPILVLAAILLGATLLWSATPLKHYLSSQNIAQLFQSLADKPYGFLIAWAGFIVAGVLFFPVLVLIVATSLLYGPLEGFLVGLSGSLLSAATLFGAGRILQPGFSRKLVGHEWKLLRKKLSRHGALAIAILRLVPLVPYSAFNLACGSFGVSFRDFFLGTLIGMTPGIFFITVVETLTQQLWK